ncbi:MAG: RHS repeat-associated core domain-containing protein [Opitutaceae bacterium]
MIKTTYADGASVLTVYNDFGQVTKTMDPTGVTRTQVYDVFGRMITAIGANGEATETVYAELGAGSPFDRPIAVIKPSGRMTTIVYDANERVTARTVAAGTPQAATTSLAYDAVGRQNSITDPRGKEAQFFHDERGRRIKIMTALNHAITIEYDLAGRRLSETNAKGNTTRWTYDAMGRELTKTDALDQVTRRAYDAAGRLEMLTDAKGNAYQFEYGLLGRQTALVYPDGSRETVAYDVAGNKISTINRAGDVRTFAYDDRNREIRSDWSDGSQTIVKAYDAAGRMTSEDNGASRITFAFDEAGRLASETQDLAPVVTGNVFDPAARTVSYTYDEDGKKATLTYPDGSFVRYTYNARGQMHEILADGVPPPIASYEYDLAGNATRMPRENFTTTVREYDDESKVTGIVDYDARRSPLSELDYTYDEVGNRTSTTQKVVSDLRSDLLETSRDTYLYDATYQVTGADYGELVASSSTSSSNFNSRPAHSVRFTYDAVGNRVEVSEDGVVTRYATNNLNQYTRVGAFAPTHDRNGNLAGMGEWLYRYDAMNRLVEASNGTMTARFFYDAKNRCVARSYNGRVQLNTYDNWNLIEERDGNGAQQARYVHGRRIDEIVVMVNRHGVFYPHHDVLGNVIMLTGPDGSIVERYDYSVEGKVTVFDTSGKELPDSAVENRWMFTGREWLAKVGLYDYRNRMYAASIGRFIQTDPVLFKAGDVNIYRYVDNRFLRFTDPSGLTIYDLDAYEREDRTPEQNPPGTSDVGVYVYSTAWTAWNEIDLIEQVDGEFEAHWTTGGSNGWEINGNYAGLDVGVGGRLEMEITDIHTNGDTVSFDITVTESFTFLFWTFETDRDIVHVEYEWE